MLLSTAWPLADNDKLWILKSGGGGGRRVRKERGIGGRGARGRVFEPPHAFRSLWEIEKGPSSERERRRAAGGGPAAIFGLEGRRLLFLRPL